jgi:hypothetical protein
VSTTEEQLGINSKGSGIDIRKYGSGDPLRWPRDTLYSQKLALNSSESGGRSVGIVRLRTQATEFNLVSVSANVSSFSSVMQLIPLRYLQYTDEQIYCTDILLRFYREELF